MLHLCKLINTFHYDYPEKRIATSPRLDSAPPMARPIVKPRVEALSKQKQGRPAKDSSTSKYAKKTWNSSFLSRFWPCLDSRQKNSTVTWSRSVLLRLVVWFFDSFHFSISTHLSVFPFRHRPGGFFYQSPRSSGFPPPVPQRVRGFLSMDPPVFLYHLPLGFWRFFLTYNYIYAKPTRSLKLAS